MHGDGGFQSFKNWLFFPPLDLSASDSLMFRQTCKAKEQRDAKNNQNNSASGLKNWKWDAQLRQNKTREQPERRYLRSGAWDEANPVYTLKEQYAAHG